MDYTVKIREQGKPQNSRSNANEKVCSHGELGL